MSTDDKVKDAEKETESKRAHIESTLDELQRRIDSSAENVREAMKIPEKIIKNHPVAVAAACLVAGAVIGLFTNDRE